MNFFGNRSESIHFKIRRFRIASGVKIFLFLPFLYKILMLLLVSFLSFALITIQKGFELSNVKSCSMLLFSTRCRRESAEISSQEAGCGFIYHLPIFFLISYFYFYLIKACDTVEAAGNEI